MKRVFYLTIIACICTLISFSANKVYAKSEVSPQEQQEKFSIDGVWQLTKITSGNREADLTKVSYLRQYKIFDRSTYYVVNIERENGLFLVKPHELNNFTFTNSPSPRYVENGRDMQINIIDNDTYLVTWKAPGGDQLQTWKRVNLTSDLVQFMKEECKNAGRLKEMIDKNNIFK